MFSREAFVRCLFLAAGVLAALTATAGAQTCTWETFSYSDGALVGQGSWTGTAPGDAVGVLGSAAFMSATGSAEKVDAILPVNCVPCDDGTITVSFRIKGGTSGGTMWYLWFLDTQGGLVMAGFYGQAGTVAGRTGQMGLGYLTDAMNLTGGDTFDTCKAVIDTRNGVVWYYLNDSLMTALGGGRVNPASFGIDCNPSRNPGHWVGAIQLHREASNTATGTVVIDDIRIETCPGPCVAQVTPNAPQLAYALAGQPAAPAAIAYTVLNDAYNLSSLGYTVQEVDASGTPLGGDGYPWLELDKAGSDPLDPLAPGESDVVTASLNTAGLSTGFYVGYLKFTDSCSPARAYTRVVKLYIENPLTEDFNYSDMSLDRAPAWVGSILSSGVTNPVQIIGGAVKINGGEAWPSGSTFMPVVAHTVASAVPACPDTGRFSAKMKIKAGSGISNIWSVYVDGPNGDFFRWTGFGTVVRGRIGGTSLITPDITLTGPSVWDQLEAIVDTATGVKTVRFLFNGSEMGLLGYDVTGHPDPGNTFAGVRVTPIYNPGTGADFVYVDDISVTPCLKPCSDPVFDVRDTSNAVVADGHVGSHDYQAFEACATGPGVTRELSFECKCMDLNNDDAIDQIDFAVFQRCYTGSTGTVDPDCDN